MADGERHDGYLTNDQIVDEVARIIDSPNKPQFKILSELNDIVFYINPDIAPYVLDNILDMLTARATRESINEPFKQLLDAAISNMRLMMNSFAMGQEGMSPTVDSLREELKSQIALLKTERFLWMSSAIVALLIFLICTMYVVSERSEISAEKFDAAYNDLIASIVEDSSGSTFLGGVVEQEF